jgi:hypothetical protein
MPDSVSQVDCVLAEEIGAYLNGELSPAALAAFEGHLADCRTCGAELSDQKGLLHTLDLAFSPERSIELPNGFSRLVALRAESDVSGFRTWSGNGRALRLTAALGLGVGLLLVLGRGDRGPSVLKNLLLALVGLLDLLSRFFYDLAFGLVVVFRATVRWLVHAPSPWGKLSFVFFFGALIVLVRQVIRFHRR